MSDELSDVLDHAIGSKIDEVWKSCVAQVLSYNPARQVCSVKLFAKIVEKWNPIPVDPPVLNDLPVAFPGGGGFSVLFNLLPGDEVLVVFGTPITQWLLTGSTEMVPASPRRHALGDAVVIPGPRSTARIRSAAVSLLSGIMLGADDGSSAVIVDSAGVKLGDATAVDPVMVLNAQMLLVLNAIDLQLKACTPPQPGISSFGSFAGLAATKTKAR